MNIELSEVIEELLKRLSALTYENILLSKALEQMTAIQPSARPTTSDYSQEFISAPV